MKHKQNTKQKQNKKPASQKWDARTQEQNLHFLVLFLSLGFAVAWLPRAANPFVFPAGLGSVLSFCLQAHPAYP